MYRLQYIDYNNYYYKAAANKPYLDSLLRATEMTVLTLLLVPISMVLTQASQRHQHVTDKQKETKWMKLSTYPRAQGNW